MIAMSIRLYLLGVPLFVVAVPIFIAAYVNGGINTFVTEKM